MDLQILAENIRDGKASDDDKRNFLQMLNLELEEISKVLKGVNKRKHDEKP